MTVEWKIIFVSHDEVVAYVWSFLALNSLWPSILMGVKITLGTEGTMSFMVQPMQTLFPNARPMRLPFNNFCLI